MGFNTGRQIANNRARSQMLSNIREWENYANDLREENERLRAENNQLIDRCNQESDVGRDIRSTGLLSIAFLFCMYESLSGKKIKGEYSGGSNYGNVLAQTLEGVDTKELNNHFKLIEKSMGFEGYDRDFLFDQKTLEDLYSKVKKALNKKSG